MAHKFLSSVPSIYKQGAGEDKGDVARLQAFIGAIAIGDLIKSTLGPKGMDKILQPLPGEGASKETTVTNDGATILSRVWVDNPSAKILVDISKAQDQECGDGTTSVVVLAAELLRQAEQLVQQKMHPQVIIKGYRIAVEAARTQLEQCAFDNGKDEEKLRADLIKIAETTLSSKLLKHEKTHFATLAVDAILRLKGRPNLDYIQVLKKAGGAVKESYLEPGFILEKRIGVGMPKSKTGCKVCVANTPMDSDKIKIFGSRVKVDSLEAMAEIEKAERDKMKRKVEQICETGCNVFINRQLIYNYPEELFKKAGVTCIEHSDFDGTERLAAVLGGDIVSTFDDPSKIKLGECDLIEEIMIGEDKVIRFKGCKENEACTIVLRGASTHVLDEAERSLHDALAVLFQTVTQDTRVICGGGCTEMAMSRAVLERAATVGGKESVAVEAFAKALTQIPMILSENAGMDAQEMVGELKKAHATGKITSGIDVIKEKVADMEALGIYESYRSKLSGLCSAAEAAEQVIRVDDIIRNAPRQREGM
ncbi:unnamed protein product [Amoebophrya sp. A25]|nr:unnamed protein product [Amoebophrya sp. A25]|eukprot:GSA25T00012558001.1